MTQVVEVVLTAEEFADGTPAGPTSVDQPPHWRWSYCPSHFRWGWFRDGHHCGVCRCYHEPVPADVAEVMTAAYAVGGVTAMRVTWTFTGKATAVRVPYWRFSG